MASYTGRKLDLGLPSTAGLLARMRRIPGFGPRIGLPVSQDPVLQARSIAAFFLAGSALAAISLFLPAPADRRDTVLLVAVFVSGITGVFSASGALDDCFGARVNSVPRFVAPIFSPPIRSTT